MEKQQGKAPQIRFPEFKDQWEHKYGSEVFKPISDKNHISDLPILAISQEFGAVPRDLINYQISVTEKSIESYKVIEIGDFIISLRSFQGGIEYSHYKGICSPAYIILRPYIEVDRMFFKYFFKTFKYIQRLNSKLEGIRDGKMISYKYFSEIAMPFQSIPEQTRIASFFTVLDKKIAQLKQKKSLLEQYKKGVMQKTFSQEIRFKDDANNDYQSWEEIDVLNISKIEKGVQFNKEDLFSVGQYPCINGGVEPSGYSDKFNREKNTITISEGGNSCGYVNFIETQFWCGGHCYTVEPIIKIDINYLFQLLKYYESGIMSLRVGSGLPNIQKKDILRFKVRVSISLQEQTKIANFLSTIDKKIKYCQKQIEKTELWKRGLLQKLFFA